MDHKKQQDSDLIPFLLALAGLVAMITSAIFFFSEDLFNAAFAFVIGLLLGVLLRRHDKKRR